MEDYVMAKYFKKYSNEIKNIIDNTFLTNDQENILKNCLFNIKPYLKEVFEDMYKLFINDLSCNEIGQIYNKNERTIQYIFKNFGLERNLHQAQKIAVKKRDYIKIRKSYKKTMLKRLTNNQLQGSSVESVIRHEISQMLQEALSNEYEIIVGINTITSAGELDIPIIIIYGENHYKFGVEVDGIFFHEGKTKISSDFQKNIKLKKLGYKIFRLETKAYYRENSIHGIKYYNEIKNKLIDICNDIYNIIINDSTQS